MSTGIVNEVAIIGMGCTCFGALQDDSINDLAAKAFREAFEDAGIERKDIGACWFNIHYAETSSAKSEISLGNALKLPNTSVTKTENYNNSGLNAFLNACYAVASGACNIALALGVEKRKNIGNYDPKNLTSSWNAQNSILSMSPNTLGQFALMANSYFAKYGFSREDGRRAQARVSFKNHRNGTLNPKAYLRNEVRIEEIINAPIVEGPIGLFDCSQISNGAAAAIICRANKANQYRKDPIYVQALQGATISDEDFPQMNQSGAHIETTNQAAIRAYKEAGISNPREEISLLETHDCCSMAELLHGEDLLISPYGKIIEDMDAGFYDLDGKIPCQPDGGFKCFGDPVGASEIRMIYEVYNQLQGNADSKRQIGNPRIGLTHHLGGTPFMSVASITILANQLKGQTYHSGRS